MAFPTQCGDRADCGCLKIKDFSKMALVVDADEQRVISRNILQSMKWDPIWICLAHKYAMKSLLTTLSVSSLIYQSKYFPHSSSSAASGIVGSTRIFRPRVRTTTDDAGPIKCYVMTPFCSFLCKVVNKWMRRKNCSASLPKIVHHTKKNEGFWNKVGPRLRELVPAAKRI